MGLCSAEGSDWLLILRASLNLEINSCLLELVLCLAELADLSECVFIGHLFHARHRTNYCGIINMNKKWFLCLYCLHSSCIGHLRSFIYCWLETGRNESGLKINHSALYFPIVLCFITVVVMLFVCWPPTLHCDLWRTVAGSDSCLYCHRVKDMLCKR